MRGAKRFVLVVLAWTVPAVLSTSLIVVRQRDADAAGWWPTLAGQLPSWWLWALLTPLVMALCRRVPVTGPRWWRPLAVHAGAGLVVVLVYLAAEAPFAVLREGRDLTATSWASATVGGVAFLFVTNYLIYFALVGVGHAWASARALREKELHASRLETQLADARLESLKAQLQPHFLFNTLHAIGGLVRQGEGQKAVRMIAGLSTLLRHTLDQVTSPEIPLHAELEALERYVEIEEIRFEGRLEFERSIDPVVIDVAVPALLLQPLVENAIRHGLAHRSESGRVTISARGMGDSLLIRVSDDGAGVAHDFDVEARAGVGLRTTRRRLTQLYGDAASLDVKPLEPHGTEVVVRLPQRSEGAPERSR